MTIMAKKILSAVEDILPTIRQCSEEIDSNGFVSDAVIGQLLDAGVFSMLAPKRYGGYELGLDSYAEVIARISEVSPSTGWVVTFLAGASWRHLAFPERAQDEFFEGQNYVLGAGSAALSTQITAVDGGYLISGRTAWNSGSSHAQWFTTMGLIPSAEGVPQAHMFAIPRDDVKLEGNWNILGMKGTASVDLSLDNVFVPTHRTAPLAPCMEGRSPGHLLHDNPIYHLPLISFAMTEVTPVLVGAHRGAVGTLIDRVRNRVGTLSGAKVSGNVAAQIRMAQAHARVFMAEQAMAGMLERIMDSSRDRSQPVWRAEIKLLASTIASHCLDSVNDVARGMGADALRDGAPFQRFFRDVNTVARHGFLDTDTASESFGKLLLGLPVADALI